MKRPTSNLRRVSTPVSRRSSPGWPARKTIPACQRYLSHPFWQEAIKATGSTHPSLLLDYLASKYPTKYPGPGKSLGRPTLAYSPRRPWPRTYLKNTEIRGHAALWNTRPAPGWHGNTDPLFQPGCFARMLREIEGGRREVRMGLDHEGTIATTADGSLRLAEDDRGLAFSFNPADTPEGRHAVEEMRLGRFKGASVWLSRQRPAYRRVHSFVPTVEALDVAVEEVSLCYEAAVPQTGETLALYEVAHDGQPRRWNARTKRLAETLAEGTPARLPRDYRGHAPVAYQQYLFWVQNPQLFTNT